MVENFILKGRKDIVNDIPVVIGIRYTTERGVGVEFSKCSLDEDALTMRVDIRILVVRIVLGVLRGVGTHNEMFSGNRTESNLFLLTITVVVMLEVRNDRDGGTIHKRQAPSGTGLQCSIKALVATEIKVTESTTARNVAITGLVIPLVNNLTVSVADSSTDHRIPHLGRNQGFKGLTKPSEIRMGVGDAEDRAMDRNNHTFWKRNHLNREITQAMEFLNLLIITKTLAESIVHNPGIFSNNLFLSLVEKVLVKVINQPGLAECLEAEIHNTIPSVDTGRTRGKIRHALGHTLIEHFRMNRLVEIFE